MSPHIHPTAQIGTNVTIGTNTTIGPNVVIGDNSTIEAFCIIGYEGSRKRPTVIGSNSHIRSHTVLYGGSSFGIQLHIGHQAVIRSHVSVGDHCSIGTHADIQDGVVIGDYSRIHSSVFLAPTTTIGRYVWIMPSVTTTDDKLPPSQKSQAPIIEDFAVIGASCILLPGITIGSECVVGAASIVTKSIPNTCLAYGNPAKVIGAINTIPRLAKQYPWMQRFTRGMPWAADGYDVWKNKQETNETK